MALTAADVVLLLLVTPLLGTALLTALSEDSEVGGGAPPGGTPNTDWELYWLTV